MSTSLVITEQSNALAVRADALALADEFTAEMDRRVSAGEMSEATRQTYARGLGFFIDYALARRAVDANVVRAWLASLRGDYRPAAINTWFAGVRAFFGWAEGERKIAYNPCAGIKSVQRRGAHTKHEREALTDKEVLRVLALPDESDAGIRDRAYLYLRAYTACRDIELHRANVDDLTTKQGKLVLNVQGKGRISADEFVVLTAEVEQTVRDWLVARKRILSEHKVADDKALFVSLSDRSFGKRLSLRAIRDVVKGYYRAAGVTEKNKTSHSLRHSAISNAVRHGAPVQKARSMARHASIDTTMIYYHEQDRISDPAEERIRYNGTDEGGDVPQ